MNQSVKTWISLNFLLLNSDLTEVVVFEPEHLKKNLLSQLRDLELNCFYMIFLWPVYCSSEPNTINWNMERNWTRERSELRVTTRVRRDEGGIHGWWMIGWMDDGCWSGCFFLRWRQRKRSYQSSQQQPSAELETGTAAAPTVSTHTYTNTFTCTSIQTDDFKSSIHFSGCTRAEARHFPRPVLVTPNLNQNLIIHISPLIQPVQLNKNWEPGKCPHFQRWPQTVGWSGESGPQYVLIQVHTHTRCDVCEPIGSSYYRPTLLMETSSTGPLAPVWVPDCWWFWRIGPQIQFWPEGGKSTA